MFPQRPEAQRNQKNPQTWIFWTRFSAWGAGLGSQNSSRDRETEKLTDGHLDRCVYSRQIEKCVCVCVCVCVSLIRPEREDCTTPKRLILVRSCCLCGNSFGHIVRPAYSPPPHTHTRTHAHTHTHTHTHTRHHPDLDLTGCCLQYPPTWTPPALLAVGCSSSEGNNCFIKILL